MTVPNLNIEFKTEYLYYFLAVLGFGFLFYFIFRKKEEEELTQVLAVLKQKKYKIFEREKELNLVAVRNRNYAPNKFNDVFWVFWKEGKNWNWHKFTNFTTLAGLYYLKNPMNAQGCAILAEGQYFNSHKIGLHKGEYEALTQQNPMKVYRDNNKDDKFDFVNLQNGNYGLNIHRASKNDSQEVDKWSGACQVFGYYASYLYFMNLCRTHRNLYGNNFTYTLI